jgi:hypothetical protein
VLQPQEHLQHLLIPQKTWAVNKWAGKRLVYTSGTVKEQKFPSNTVNTLTYSFAIVPDTTTILYLVFLHVQ